MGPALEDAGFTDLGALDAAVANINCLAYYGVTIGYGDGTFGPGNDVTRGQMVLLWAWRKVPEAATSHPKRL